MNANDHFGWAGHTIDGKYRVERAVGEGAFGVVYRAHHLGFDEPVALKCLKLPPGLRGPDRDEFFRRFLAEGRILNRLSRSSTGIVQALDLGAATSPRGLWAPYLVLEWLEGRSLADDLEQRARRGQGGRGFVAAASLLEPAALALASAHEQGVAHRDVKPANLFLALVGGRPTVKVLDFGIAKVFAEGPVHDLTASGGTSMWQAFSPLYAAPEQFDRAYGRTGPATDVFSLALVLLEVASGRPALAGESLAELFVASTNRDRRPSLRAQGVPCPAAVDQVVARALAVDPAARFATVSDFWRALAEAAHDAPASAPATAPAARGTGAPRGELPPPAARGTGAPRGELPPPDRAPTPPPLLPHHAPTGSALPPDRTPTGSAPPPALLASRDAPTAHPRATLAWLAALASAAALSFALVQRSASRADAPGPPPAGNVSGPTPTPAPAGPEGPAPARRIEPAPALRERRIEGGLLPLRPGETRARAGSFVVRGLGAAAPLDYVTAARACRQAGLALCSEAQWQLACAASPSIAPLETWTSSLEPRRGAVRRGGAGGCGARRVAAPAEPLAGPGQACCSRSLAVDADALPGAPAPPEAERKVLAFEAAFNRHDVAALRRQLDGELRFFLITDSRERVGALFAKAFREDPDLWVLHEGCAIGADIDAWSAECLKVAGRGQELALVLTRYEFGRASGLVRSITDERVLQPFTAASALAPAPH
ncbi:MAG TPA: protein kinase [Polyangiaceae bacterium]|nr:protein kinase [Polyangiaceae bacterium]